MLGPRRARDGESLCAPSAPSICASGLVFVLGPEMSECEAAFVGGLVHLLAGDMRNRNRTAASAMASPWIKVSVANRRVVVLWDPSAANREGAVEIVLEAQLAVAGTWMEVARAPSPIGILSYDRLGYPIERARFYRARVEHRATRGAA